MNRSSDSGPILLDLAALYSLEQLLGHPASTSSGRTPARRNHYVLSLSEGARSAASPIAGPQPTHASWVPGQHRIRLTVGEPPTCIGCGSILHPALSRTVQEVDDPRDEWIKKLDSARLDKSSASFACGRAHQVGSAAEPFRDSLAALKIAAEKQKDVTLQNFFNEKWVGARQPEPTTYDPREPLTSGAGSHRAQTSSRLPVPEITETDASSERSGGSGRSVREHFDRVRGILSRHRGSRE